MRCQESDRGTVLSKGVGTKGSGSSPASDDADRAQKAGRRGKAPCCVAASSVEERVSILRLFENPKKQSDGGGRLNPSRFLFCLAFLSWPLAPVRRIALFLQDS